MRELFKEDFAMRCGNLPGGWMIERNSDLKNPALTFADNKISLLSAGNKYIPVIPDVCNFLLKLRYSANFELARNVPVIISFRYDIKRHTGEAVRITCISENDNKEIILEYGKMGRNIFVPEQEQRLQVAKKVFETPLELTLEAEKTKLQISLAGTQTIFKAKAKGQGKVAISREHFFDILDIMQCEIFSGDKAVVLSEKKFRIPMPTEPTLYPIFCDLVLRDFGNCMDAEMTFSGGVRDTPPGEGNYHGMRADWLLNPFIKVVTTKDTTQYNFHDGYLLLVHDELAPWFMWKFMHKKMEWPYSATVRFLKPEDSFDLAIGFETYLHTTLKSMEQSPSETLFNLDGKVLSSGLGITSAKVKTEFLSQPNKKMAKRIPKNDPRYQQAIEFLQNNHYFIEGEKQKFSIRLTGQAKLPGKYIITLEDAFMRPISQLSYKSTLSSVAIGVRDYNTVLLAVKMPSKPLKPGVYHLRFSSDDPVAAPLVDYCAFEIMSSNAADPPPPLLSGLPYMYNARTETRGLETDSFDPWNGKSVDDGHYIACTNFLPAAARKYQVAPTVNAYGREWFLWLGTRCCENPSIKENEDLIAQADYLNVAEEKKRTSLLWLFSYTGWKMEKFYEFAKKLNDPEFDLSSLKAKLDEAAKTKQNSNIEFVSPPELRLDYINFSVMAKKYWFEWLAFINQEFAKKDHALLVELRKKNKKIKYAEYGPAHIYAAHLKGPEFTSYLMTKNTTPDKNGFWQYEDYPYACAYRFERGTYFLASCLMVMPGQRIYPEIYTGYKYGGIGGCPDGAVFYAHPPIGSRKTPDWKARSIMIRSYYYAFASGYFKQGKFHFWDKCGYQACAFNRAWYEQLLYSWRTVHDFPPARPFRSAAYVYSEESFKASPALLQATSNQKLENSGILDVRKTATEDGPYVYETAMGAGVCAGFQTLMEEISKLTPEAVDTLVLPPLTGVSQKYKEVIRKLHSQGVNLLAFEDINGLEDIFGLKDTGKYTQVTEVRPCGEFLPASVEYSSDPVCKGKYAAAGAEVLLMGEIPVLTIKDNGKAKAAFYNVPPHFVRQDELHLRLGYGKDSISKMMEEATVKIMKLLSCGEVVTSAGSIIAYQAKNGCSVIIVANQDMEDGMLPSVTIRKGKGRKQLLSVDRPYNIVAENSKSLTLEIKLKRVDAAVIILGE